MTPYPVLRTVHLLCGVFAVPALVMYGISAVQMAHSKWFSMKPQVSESDTNIKAGYVDGRQMALEAMRASGVKGEIASVKPSVSGFDVRVTVTGTVNEIGYAAATGRVHVKRTVNGPLGMLNRLHHAAGIRPAYLPLRLWGVLVALVSVALIGLGCTGIWMWWLRKQERVWGLVALAANLAFAFGLLVSMRMAGP